MPVGSHQFPMTQKIMAANGDKISSTQTAFVTHNPSIWKLEADSLIPITNTQVQNTIARKPSK